MENEEWAFQQALNYATKRDKAMWYVQERSLTVIALEE